MGRHSLSFGAVVDMLREAYDKAKRLKYVSNPMAYALYHVWREVDVRGVVELGPGAGGDGTPGQNGMRGGKYSTEKEEN